VDERGGDELVACRLGLGQSGLDGVEIVSLVVGRGNEGWLTIVVVDEISEAVAVDPFEMQSTRSPGATTEAMAASRPRIPSPPGTITSWSVS